MQTAALLAFRILDPACGSGNFLYVAFRELYRLDTELLARIREFPSTEGQGKAKVTWGVGIQTANFFGIDRNPFAVELAKVTLNIARKIAFDERREIAADLVWQIELDVDPSLPLDNLDKNILCADALSRTGRRSTRSSVTHRFSEGQRFVQSSATTIFKAC